MVSDLNLTDRDDGLHRMILHYPDMLYVPGPLTKDPPSDQHTLSFFRVNYMIVEDCRLEASVVEEALKFSDCHFVWVRNCTLIGGHEDALDVVRGSQLIFENVHFISRGARAVTIKGGVDSAYFLNCTFSGSAMSGAFVELGDWSDYDKNEHPPTKNIFIGASNEFDLRPIQVRRGSLRRQQASYPIRPVRTYYTKDTHIDHRTEHLPDVFMTVYFTLQNWVQ